MSVENFDQLSGAMEFLEGETPDLCFKCGKPLSGVNVLWYGGGKAIGLHPDCGIELAAHLARDSLHARWIVEGKHVTAGATPWADTS